jgi:N-acetylneuraminic acid mutarotase
MTVTAYLNDLWRYDMNTNEWTWIKGSTTQVSPVYGTKGVAAAANTPRGWVYSLASTAPDGIWLFGGGDYYIYGVVNSLWHFDGTDWTWISGDDQTAINRNYPSRGVPSTVHYPGPRHECAIWRISDTQFYIYGGYGATENPLSSHGATTVL